MTITRGLTVAVAAVAVAVVSAGCGGSKPADGGSTAASATSTATASPSSAPAGSTTLRNRDGLDITIAGPIYAKWVAVGAEPGALDQPIGPEQAVAGGGKLQAFEGGVIVVNKRGDAYVVWGAIRDAWVAKGGVSGPLGYPVSDETDYQDNGRMSQFEHGTITYDFNTDRVEVHLN
jgi:uncharacterized protein with LGFP repeats